MRYELVVDEESPLFKYGPVSKKDWAILNGISFSCEQIVIQKLGSTVSSTSSSVVCACACACACVIIGPL